MENDDFEEQIRQQEIEEKSTEDVLGKKRVKVDDDGTEYDWDDDKKAWFPKIDQDFIAKYQMQYGSYKDPDAKEDASSKTDKDKASSDHATPTSQAPDPSDPGYAQWYYSHYYGQSSTGTEGGLTDATPSPEVDTTSEAYRVWYEYYYGSHATAETKGNDEQNDSGVSVGDFGKEGREETQGKSDSADSKDSEMKSGSQGSESAIALESGKPDSSHDAYYEYWKEFYAEGDGKKRASDSDYYKDYWTWYYTYYGNSDSSQEQSSQESTEGDKDAGKKEGSKDQKGMKRGPNVERGWFDMDNEKSTSVYISGLPTDITEDQYKELMNKCGMVMLDPFTRKLKLKLYKDKEGNLKGDGLCVYIKPESVELALNILDDYEYEGHKLHVEIAKFELKGKFDPSKNKKRKLGNKAKRKFIEKQEKLFDWRPDKVVGGRDKCEKVVIIKNVFDPKEFEVDPTQINEIRNDLREELAKHGEVKKVTVYDRHPDGICSVSYKEAEEADACIEALRGRWFAKRRLLVQQWDGKTKYDIEESEEEREARMAKWANFLGDEEGKKKGNAEKKTETAQQQGDEQVASGQAAVTADTVNLPPEGAQSQSKIEGDEEVVSGEASVTADTVDLSPEGAGDEEVASGQAAMETDTVDSSPEGAQAQS